MEVEQESAEFFKKCLNEDPHISVPLAAIRTLIHVIDISNTETITGLFDTLKSVIKRLKEDAEDSVTSITSGCELLLRFITLTEKDLLAKDFSECKKALVNRGMMFWQDAQNSRQKIANISEQFIQDGSVILTHSSSRVVIQLLLEAAKRNKQFFVYVTESMPKKQGYETHKKLHEGNIPCTVILDAAAGYIMERVDMVLLGAESVVESGGIINRIGSYQLAVMAKALNKPVYVAAERFKFLRQYPLKQREVANKHKYLTDDDGHPLVDYTPPSLISLLFTDFGILTPSAVSDELIKLYL